MDADRTGGEREQLRADLLSATEFLRRIGADRELLVTLSPQEKQDLLNAAGDVFCPDPEERRIRTKALKRQRRSQRVRRDEDVLAGTGIRTLREQPVFTTPNAIPPDAFEQRDVDDDGHQGNPDEHRHDQGPHEATTHQTTGHQG